MKKACTDCKIDNIEIDRVFKKRLLCSHPVSKQTIWRVWTTFFKNAPYTNSNIKIVLECECGKKTTLENQIDDNNEKI